MSTILVTGASSGIGKATAERLLQGDHRVYVAARRVDRMADLVERGATGLGLDITREDDIRAAVSRITVESGGVDVLVNNAGFAQYGPVENVPIDDARYQFEVNLFGLARLTQAVLPHMREQGAGRILNVSSIGGKIFTPMGAWYHATKHALEGWSDCLRMELAPFGIDVVIIEPGIIHTEFTEVMQDRMADPGDDSPYAPLIRKVNEATRKAYERRTGSPPSVVAETVAKAIAAEKPKTRYVTGAMAGRLLFLRRWLGDRLYERAVMSQF